MPDQTHFEWRAVAWDNPGREGVIDPYERGDWHTDLDEAQRELAVLENGATPPFDDTWIERRSVTVSEPERVDVAALPSKDPQGC